jgi:hypothetical protein
MTNPTPPPGEETAPSTRWLSSIRTLTSATPEAATLAYLLVLPSTEGDSAFWDEEAAALRSGLLLYVAAHEPDERHLGTVRAYLTLGSTGLGAVTWGEAVTVTPPAPSAPLGEMLGQVGRRGSFGG